MSLFIKNQEDFICEHCGEHNVGNGYTNHCSQCLWSKHVDIEPGDRSNSCLGLMKPVSIEQKDNDYIIIHKCEKCGFEKRNRTWPQDNFQEIVRLSNPQLL